MKAMIFDAGPIISLTTNNLLWLLAPLKEKFGGEFYITENVRKELVEKPLKTKKFKFEALQVQDQIENGVLKVIKNGKTKAKAEQLLNIANNVFYVHKHPLRTLQAGELETLAAAKLMNFLISLLMKESPAYCWRILVRWSNCLRNDYTQM